MDFSPPKSSPSKEIHVKPAFFTIFREGYAAGDSFIVALHVKVMADVGIVLVFIRVAFTAGHKSFFIFPHHFEVGIGDFDGCFSPRRIEVRTGILGTFAAIAKMTVSFIRSKVISSFLVGTSLFFFGSKGQRIQTFGCSILIDFVEARLTPIFAEERFARRRRGHG